MHTAKHCIRTHGSVPYTPSFDARQCQLDHKLQLGQPRPFVPHHPAHQIRLTSQMNPLSHGTGLKSPQITMTLLNFRRYPLRTHRSTTIHLRLHLHHRLSLAQNQNPSLSLITTMNPVSISFPSTPSYSSAIFLFLHDIIYIPYPRPLWDFLLLYPRLLYGLPDYGPFPSTSERPLPLNDYHDIY